MAVMDQVPARRGMVALAVGLATAVIVAMYVVYAHALDIKPGLLRVHVGSLHPELLDHVTVTVRSEKRVIAEFTPGPDGQTMVPDLAHGVYRVSLSYLDFRMAERTIEIHGHDGTNTLRAVSFSFVPPPPGDLWYRLRASRPDPTDRLVAREVYALVLGYLTDRIGNRVLVESEAAHSEGAVFQNAAHGIIPLSDSIRRALREPANRQVVWHHDGIFPSAVTVVNKADVLNNGGGHPRWRAILGLGETETPHILSVSRVFVSDEGTQAIVFVHDWCPHCGRGDLFWLKRSTPAAPWVIERVDMTWIS